MHGKSIGWGIKDKERVLFYIESALFFCYTSFMKFTIELANKTIRIHSLYDEVYEMCKGYYVEDEKVDFEVISTQDLIDQEKDHLPFPDSYLETVSIYRQIIEKMLDYSTFMMHGSVLASDRKHAFMFTAPSGTGKTTHTNLWLQNCPSAFVVNGDKPLLKVEGNQVLAYGTPWSGKERMNTNCCVPLKAIVILERGEKNRMEEIRFTSRVPFLLEQIYRPKNRLGLRKTLRLVEQLSKHVKVYRYISNNFLDDAFSCTYDVLKSL
ncbi:MAG: hypothetical protein Q4C49_03270 [Bacillota bacterium]|nr:hypothetical protein [Bacillota bacterium]